MSAPRLVPAPLRKALKPILKYPPLYYAGTAARLVFIRMFDTYSPAYRADQAALLEDWEETGPMFSSSIENFRSAIEPFRSEFKWFIGRIYNGFFQSVDAELYYSMIRTHKPKLIVEVGSGHSTLFALDALERNGSGEILSIDPDARRKLPSRVTHIRSLVEQVDPEVFDRLRDGDFLFIDTSHTTEEANFHVSNILPRLKPGVIVHHHDFHYPYSVYWNNDRQTYGETDVLIDYYSSNKESWEVLVGAAYVRHKAPEVISELLPAYKWAQVMIPGSLWMRKKS